MHQRHAYNPNLVLLDKTSHWNNLPIQTQCGPLIDNYLSRILRVLNDVVMEYKRVSVMRFDLRFPSDSGYQDTAVISRFIEALKSRLRADALRKKRDGRRVYPCDLRYVWVKEQNGSTHSHYHVCIFLNRDAYFTLGRFRGDNEVQGYLSEDNLEGQVNMADRIKSAWQSALGISPDSGSGLVHFPNNAVYHISFHSAEASQQYTDVFYRLSYFAKAATKHYGNHSNHFGCSRT